MPMSQRPRPVTASGAPGDLKDGRLPGSRRTSGIRPTVAPVPVLPPCLRDDPLPSLPSPEAAYPVPTYTASLVDHLGSPPELFSEQTAFPDPVACPRPLLPPLELFPPEPVPEPTAEAPLVSPHPPPPSDPRTPVPASSPSPAVNDAPTVPAPPPKVSPRVMPTPTCTPAPLSRSAIAAVSAPTSGAATSPVTPGTPANPNTPRKQLDPKDCVLTAPPSSPGDPLPPSKGEAVLEAALQALDAEVAANGTARSTLPPTKAKEAARGSFRNDFFPPTPAGLPEREQGILRGRRTLGLRLQKLDTKEAQVRDDGNCLFRAVSHQLYGSESHHPYLRCECVRQIQAHRQQYVGCFFESDRHFDRYCHVTSHLGSWGDEISLKALVDRFKVVAYVVVSTPGKAFLRYSPDSDLLRLEGLGIESLKRIFITYLAPIHYNSVAYDRQFDPLPPPELRRARASEPLLDLLTADGSTRSRDPSPLSSSTQRSSFRRAFTTGAIYNADKEVRVDSGTPRPADPLTSPRPATIVSDTTSSTKDSGPDTATGEASPHGLTQLRRRMTETVTPRRTSSVFRPTSSASVRSRSAPVEGDDEYTVGGAGMPSDVVEVYEHQRRYPVKGWSCRVLPTDRPRWGSEDGQTRLFKVKYEPDWTYVAGMDTDAEGWQYATNFTARHGWHSTPSTSRMVRRRRWVRAGTKAANRTARRGSNISDEANLSRPKTPLTAPMVFYRPT